MHTYGCFLLTFKAQNSLFYGNKILQGSERADTLMFTVGVTLQTLLIVFLHTDNISFLSIVSFKIPLTF